MRRLILLAACLAASPIMAQPSAKDALKDLQAELVGKPLFLQGFSADPVTTFDWTNNTLVVSPPQFRTFGVFTATKLKLHHDTLEIDGVRHTYHEDPFGKPDAATDSPALIEVDLHGADAAQVLPALKAQLFFPTLEAAVAAIPPNYTAMFHFGADPHRRRRPAPDACPTGHTRGKPAVLFSPEAEYSEEARRARISGNVQVLFTVDENGHPFDIWITRGVGFGLDRQGALSASGYEFRPATCDGEPIKVSMFIEVNFQIF